MTCIFAGNGEKPSLAKVTYGLGTALLRVDFGTQAYAG